MKNLTPNGWFPWIRQRWLRITAELTAWVLACALLGLAIGAGVKAVGAEGPSTQPSSTQPSSTQTPSTQTPSTQRCVDMSQDPCRHKAVKFAVRKFRHDRLGHAHPRERRIFVHPRAARKAMIYRFRHALHRREVAAPAARAGARAAYTRWLRRSDCGAYRPYNPYSTGIDVCSLAGPRNKITPEEIRHGVTVVICGAGVVVGAIAAPPSGTASWWVLGMGATSCFWGAYLEASAD